MRDLDKPSTDEENNEYYRIDAAPQNTNNLPFLDNYRNPCWRELSVNGSGTRIRCLPYFYLVGAPKSGTTDLHRRLTRHPLISSLVPKEPHWLGRQEFFKGGRKNLSDYLEMFDLAVAKDITQIQHNGYFPAIFGDCSASTLWDRNYMLSDSHGNLPSPIYTNAEEIYHLNPNAKIIIILRNPIKRLFSEYLFFKEDLSKEDFHSKVVYSVSRYRSCLKAHSEWYCAYYRYQKVRLHIGLYCVFIEDYMRVFPRDQIKVLKLENCSNDIPGYLADVFRFLQIGVPPNETLLKISAKKNSNTNPQGYEHIGEMLPETFDILYDFYKTFNARLVKLLGDEFDFNK